MVFYDDNDDDGDNDGDDDGDDDGSSKCARWLRGRLTNSTESEKNHRRSVLQRCVSVLCTFWAWSSIRTSKQSEVFLPLLLTMTKGTQVAEVVGGTGSIYSRCDKRSYLANLVLSGQTENLMFIKVVRCWKSGLGVLFVWNRVTSCNWPYKTLFINKMFSKSKWRPTDGVGLSTGAVRSQCAHYSLGPSARPA